MEVIGFEVRQPIHNLEKIVTIKKNTKLTQIFMFILQSEIYFHRKTAMIRSSNVGGLKYHLKITWN